MVVTRGISSYSVGTCSELMAAAAFSAEGCDVAFPISNARGWDMVVRLPSGEWKSVQVKTGPLHRRKEFPTIQIARGGRAKRPVGSSTRLGYDPDVVDYLVVVDITSEIIWKIPMIEVAGMKRVRLDEKYLWQGLVEYVDCFKYKPRKPYVVQCRESQAEQRASIRQQLPHIQPEGMSDKTWRAILGWCDGLGYKTISKEFGVSISSVRERIFRGLYAMKLRNLPETMIKKAKK